ncbi:MAG: hypothetical protein IIA61_03130 [Candidatus Marinimicrobia bacterium]|nr:hypothetical protein [Candidatus Neomarinimicrobiota bacterium]
MNTLISGLIVAGATGLAFVAYKHPKEFKIIENILSIVGGSVLLGIIIWNGSAELISAKLLGTLEETDEAKKVLSDHLIFEGYILYTWISAFLYLGFLRLLPHLGIIDKEKENSPEQQKESKLKDDT